MGTSSGELLGYILDKDAHVTFLGLKFGQRLLFCVNHLLSYFWAPEFLHYILGLKYW